jgi:hypothetical protein
MRLEVTTLVHAGAASAVEPPPLPESPPLEPPPPSPGSVVGVPELLPAPEEPPELLGGDPLLLSEPEDEAPLLPLEVPFRPRRPPSGVGAAVEPQPMARKERKAIAPMVTTWRATPKSRERRVTMLISRCLLLRLRCHARRSAP